VNGVTPGITCNQSGCHNSFALNSGTGSVNIGGLPATWVPGQTYPLTVTVTGGTRYGFQLSAVSNTTNGQAGTLQAASPNDSRVQFINGPNGVRYAQHNATFFSPTTPFSFRWTAPANANFGPVRFNVAGNAANADATSLGDRIYTTLSVVNPAAVDSTPPVISAVNSSSIATSAATITWTTDEPSDTQVEFGTTTSYGQSTTLDATLGTSHFAVLSGLASNTTYHYRVKSSDAASNLAASADNTFITAFGISNLGGVSRITDGTGPLVTGYGRILANSGTTPSGVAIFGLRQAGILVTEAGVPDSPLITSGRIYAEVSADGFVNTGVAMVNPNTQDATITIEIRDTAGTLLSARPPITLKAIGSPCNPGAGDCNHMASFLDQAPYLVSQGFQGTVTFTSTVPISIIALRSLLNERAPKDFLLTTLPVLNLAAGASSGTQVIPHFAAGGGWTTQIILLNPTASIQTGTIQFLDGGVVTPPTPGGPTTVNIDGAPGTTTAYSVAANSSKKFLVTGASPGTASGSVRIVPTAAGGPAPTPLVIFSYKPESITVSEAGVPVTMGTTFRMFAQLSPAAKISTGVAIANATAVAGTVTLTLTDLNGVQIAQTTPLALPASGQIARFLDQVAFTPSLAGQTVAGVLRITTDLANISVVGLRTRINERPPSGDFLITTTPPTLENGAATAAERVFPHLVDGGGYTTQIILFSGTAGQTSGGTLSFVSHDGTPLSLNIN